MGRGIAAALATLIGACSGDPGAVDSGMDAGDASRDVSDAGVDAATDTLSPGADSGGDASDAGMGLTTCASTVPRRPFDAEAAERGRRLLTETVVPPGLLPRLGVDNLWIVWGTGSLTGEAYWAEFRRRYGFARAPFENGGLPMGIREVGGQVTFDCLTCHGGEVVGVPVIGATNTLLDFESLYDDLVALNELAPMFGYPMFDVPLDLDGFTPAAGTTDSFGLAMTLALGEPVSYGPQRAPAWWTIATKDFQYTDGSAVSGTHRTMMAMFLAFGLPRAELMAMEDEIADIGAFIESLEPPCWPFEPPDELAVVDGEAIFTRECAGCHGAHDGETPNPGRVLDVGTDSMRHEAWTEREVSATNASWFGEPPTRDTDGYLAQPLVGIWARAPYLHNGSIPDLRSLLNSSERPARWRRTGSERSDYDPDAVGWRYDVVEEPADADTLEGRRVVDTSRGGLGNGGHTFGDSLSDAERDDLLAYLRTL